MAFQDKQAMHQQVEQELAQLQEKQRQASEQAFWQSAFAKVAKANLPHGLFNKLVQQASAHVNGEPVKPVRLLGRVRQLRAG